MGGGGVEDGMKEIYKIHGRICKKKKNLGNSEICCKLG
jgi:hypothetical protein